MVDEITKVIDFIGNAFLHIWPYLIVTIPLAVAVNMSGASKYFKRAFDASPVTAVFLATAIGAFSPFCSCGVIPIVAALLISGVPLAPVMSFWIASPSMDPEIFFLSVATIGWNLAIWRLAGTLVLSLGAGLITHLATQKHWIGNDILRSKNVSVSHSAFSVIHSNWLKLKVKMQRNWSFNRTELVAATITNCCENSTFFVNARAQSLQAQNVPASALGSIRKQDSVKCKCSDKTDFLSRLLRESLNATTMVIKFMSLAFLLEALIILYIPERWVINIMGQGNSWAIITAAILGVPTYTNNLSALPMISGLLAQGMNPAAALAFLIAGPTTTLPAMAAVWPLVSHRIFALYVSFALMGSIILGYLKQFFG